MALLRKLLALSAFTSLSVLALAQVAPAPAMSGPNPSDVAASYMIVGKKDAIGYSGADIAYTKYFSRHWAFRAQADLERMSKWNYCEYGYRGGAVYKLAPQSRTQPYLNFLLGFARTKGDMFEGPRTYHDGLSLLGGGGIDHRISSGWYLRTGADLVANNSDKGYGSLYGRVLIGFDYRFDHQQ